MNLIINMEDDQSLIYSDDSATLAWLGCGKEKKNEKKVIFFSLIRER